MTATNPLLTPSPLQYHAPEFDKIKVEHYQPAMEQGIAEHAAEIEKIANNPDAATFENTIVAMEQSGDLLERASSVFYNMTGTISNDEILKIQTAMSPKLAAHSDNINLNPTLFARIKAIYDNRANLNLDAESVRLVESLLRSFCPFRCLTDRRNRKTKILCFE